MTNHVVVKKSSAGLGLFANRDFKKGERVIEYVGEKISEAEAQRRGGLYLFELNDKWTIDGKARTNTARYINHSCAPNCYPELNSSETRVFIITKRAIKAGEELTYNYGKQYYDIIMGPAKCRCTKCTKKRSNAVRASPDTQVNQLGQPRTAAAQSHSQLTFKRRVSRSFHSLGTRPTRAITF